MSTKSKGSNAERELIKLFWSAGWAAIRSAGSGSMHYPSPDILAGNKIRRIAIEAKATKGERKYFAKEDLKDLINFSSYFGCEPWIAIRFSGREWVFVNPEDLKETKEGYSFGVQDIDRKGLTFEEVISSSH